MVKVTVAEGKMANCSICEKFEELRPYGKDGAWVCFDCAMKDEKTAHEQFKKMHEQGDVLIVGMPAKTEN